MILIADPEMIKEIMVKQFNNFTNRQVYILTVVPLNYNYNNIIMSTDELHVNHCEINSLLQMWLVARL